MFKVLETHSFKNELGTFEVDVYRDFYTVKRKIKKGIYDPTAFVVAKKDKNIPFFPDTDFTSIFGHGSSFMFFWTGKTGKDHFQETMRQVSCGLAPIGTPMWWRQFLKFESKEKFIKKHLKEHSRD